MILHEIKSQPYEPGKLAFSVDVPADAVGVRISLTREDWPEGECAALTFTATAADGETATKGPTRFGGGKIMFRDHNVLVASRGWQWGGLGIGGWCSAEKTQDGKPVFNDAGTEDRKPVGQRKPVYSTFDDAKQPVEQPINMHQPITIDVLVEILQPLRTSIVVEVF